MMMVKAMVMMYDTINDDGESNCGEVIKIQCVQLMMK